MVDVVRIPKPDYDELRATVERLQRENGALARTYALAEEKLRERTEALNEVLAQNERFDKRYRDAEDEVERLQRSCDRLRASMETAAALARHSDSDLANAMLQALDRSSC